MDLFRKCSTYREKLNVYYLYKASVEARYECLKYAVKAARKEYILHMNLGSPERKFHRERVAAIEKDRKEYLKLCIRVRHKYKRIEYLVRNGRVKTPN